MPKPSEASAETLFTVQDTSTRAEIEKAMKQAESTSARITSALKGAATTAGIVGAGVVAAPILVPVAAVAAPVAFVGGKIAERVNPGMEIAAEARFKAQNQDMVDSLSKPLPGGLTTHGAIQKKLGDHIDGSATEISREEALQMARIGEHIYKALADGAEVGPNGLEVPVPGTNRSVMVPPGNFAAKAVSWHLMAAAADANLQHEQLQPGVKRDDMTNSGTFILKDPGNRVYNFLNANPMVMDRMSTHYEERLDHDKKVPLLGNTLQKGCDDYQNKFPGGGGALLFDKMKGGEIFVKFEHAGTPNPLAKEAHDGTIHTVMRSALAANRWVEHSLSFLESLKATGGDPNKVVRQEHIHKGEMKAAVYDPYVATLKAATEAGLITKREAEAMKSHARSHGLPSVTNGLEIVKDRRLNSQTPDSAANNRVAFAAQNLERNIDYKLQTMGVANNSLGIQRRGGEVHLSADPNDYLSPAGNLQAGQSGYDPANVIQSDAIKLSANDMKGAIQASETFRIDAAGQNTFGQGAETMGYAKLQVSERTKMLQESTGEMRQALRAAGLPPLTVTTIGDRFNSLGGYEKTLATSQDPLQIQTATELRANVLQGIDNLVQRGIENLPPDQQASIVAKFDEWKAAEIACAASQAADSTTRGAADALFKRETEYGQENVQGARTMGDIDATFIGRSVASYETDRLLGTNVCSEERLGVSDDGKLLGVSVAVDGAQVSRITPVQIDGNDELTSRILDVDYASHEVQKGLYDLEALDYVTGQIDRHPGNVVIDPATKNLKGIDNDLAFPEADRATVLAHSNKAVANLPMFVHQDTAQKILNVTPAQLRESLSKIAYPNSPDKPVLSQDEIDGAVQRLGELQNHIKNLPPERLVQTFDAGTYQAAVTAQMDCLRDYVDNAGKLDGADITAENIGDIDIKCPKTSYLGSIEIARLEAQADAQHLGLTRPLDVPANQAPRNFQALALKDGMAQGLTGAALEKAVAETTVAAMDNHLDDLQAKVEQAGDRVVDLNRQIAATPPAQVNQLRTLNLQLGDALNEQKGAIKAAGDFQKQAAATELGLIKREVAPQEQKIAELEAKIEKLQNNPGKLDRIAALKDGGLEKKIGKLTAEVDQLKQQVQTRLEPKLEALQQKDHAQKNIVAQLETKAPVAGQIAPRVPVRPEAAAARVDFSSQEMRQNQAVTQNFDARIDELKQRRDKLENNPSVGDRMKAVAKHGTGGIAAEITSIDREIAATVTARELAANGVSVEDQKAGLDGVRAERVENKQQMSQLKQAEKKLESIERAADLHTTLEQSGLGSPMSSQQKTQLAREAGQAVNVRESLKPQEQAMQQKDRDLKQDIKHGDKALKVREKLGPKPDAPHE